MKRILLAAALLLAPRLAFAQTLAGTVRDANGTPVLGAVVAAVPIAAGPGELPPVLRSDSSGRFRFEHLAPGMYALTATARGLVAAFVPSIDVSAEHETNSDITLAIAGGHRLSGRTLDAAGQPHAVRVIATRFSDDEGDLFATESGADGRYELRLPDADYSVGARSDATFARPERISLHADMTRDLHYERRFAAAPPEALAWLRKSAIPLKTAEPGPLDDLAPLGAIVGDARVVALGEATHGTREFFQLKHRIVQDLVEKKGFTVFAIEATMPGTMTVNDYVVDGKGSATAALQAMQFWTWNTDEVRALIEWLRGWNATHDRKVKFLGFDMQDPAGATALALRYLAPRDAAFADQSRAALAPLRDVQTYRGRSDAAKQQVIAAIDALEKRIDAHSPHDADWTLARRMVDVLRQGETQFHGGSTPIRDRAMAENAQWILAHEPPGTKMVLWAHNGHVSTESMPNYAGGTMGEQLRKTFGKELVVIGFAFDRGNFRAVETTGAKRGLTDQNHLDAAPAGSFDATLASIGVPLFALDLRTASGVAREWLDSPLAYRSVGAIFIPERPQNFVGTMHPLRSFDAVVFVETMTAAHGGDVPGKAGPPPPPPAPAAVNLGFEEGTLGQLPAGWRQNPVSHDAGYTAQLVAEGCANGRCLSIEHAEPGAADSSSTGVVLQRVDATPFRGKRVRLRAKARTELEDPAGWAQIWLRVDLPQQKTGFFDNMLDRGLHGKQDWTVLTIEGDVAPNAEAIAFGTLFNGSGRVWYDDFSLEVIP